MAQAVRVKGYREFLAAADRAGRESKREVRGAFRRVGDIVREDAADSIGDLSPRSAAGLRTRVRQRSVAVEQSLRRTTGTRPDWGAVQMRRLVDAAEANDAAIAGEMEKALDTVADHFDR